MSATPKPEAPAVPINWLDLSLTQAAKDVLYERVRQSCHLGWSPSHDDAHGPAVLAAAAGCYALYADAYPNRGEPPPAWPWDAEWWKPKDFRNDCKRAAALLIAAMECMDRAHPEVLAKIKADKETP